MDFDMGPAVQLGNYHFYYHQNNIMNIIISNLLQLPFLSLSFYYLYHHYHHAAGPARGSEPRHCKKSRRSSLCSSSTGSFSWTRYLFFRLRVFRNCENVNYDHEKIPLRKWPLQLFPLPLFSGKLADAIVDDVWDVANIACEQVHLWEFSHFDYCYKI